MKKTFFLILITVVASFNLFSQKYFTLKDSMLIIGKVYSDSIPKQILLNIDSIAVYDTINLKDIYPATSYQMVFQSQGRYNQFAAVIGSAFTDKALKLISGSHKGDQIIIVSIRYKDAKNDNNRFPHAVHIWIK